jgi:hypothetical protein
MYCDKKISASMRERKHLHFTLELKSIDSHGRFAGYASVFDIVDNQRDVIMRGAFAHRRGIRILRDPFTEKPFVKFYATKRVGGDVINFEAIKLMKLST